MCCSSGSSSAPEAKETEFSKTMAEIMRETHADSRKYRPLQDQLIRDVEQFRSPEFANEQRGRAASDVAGAFDKARSAQTAQMTSMGLNPGDARYQFLNRGLNMAQAGSTAAAKTRAADAARRLGFDVTASVSGRGDAKVGQAMQAGSVGGNQMLDSQRIQTAWRQSQDNADAQAMGGLGSAAGMALAAMMMGSSKTYKRNIKSVDDDEALARADKLPVKRWRYLDGIGDGGAKEHIGPMAEDAQKVFGGDSKTLNVADVASTALAGVKALDKKVRRLEKK